MSENIQNKSEKSFRNFQDSLNRQRTGIQKNINPYKDRIFKDQTLTLSELMEIFGTPKQKESYKKSKKIYKATKEALLIKAKQYCEIENLETDSRVQKYKICKVYPFSLNKKLVQFLEISENETAESSKRMRLFKHILLKIVTYSILNNANENNCISFRPMKYAEDFSLVNSNYQRLRYANPQERELILKTINVSELSLNDFYNSVNRSINNNIESILKILSEVGAISLTKNMLILIKINEDGKKYKVRATEKEEGIITKAIDTFLQKNNVTNYSYLYYGKIKGKFESYMGKVLSEIGCINFYRTYEVFVTHTNLLNHILEYTDFKVENIKMYSLLLNTLFTQQMIENAEKRNDKRILNFIKSSDIFSELLSISKVKIEDLTIGNYQEKLSPEILNKAVKVLKENTEIKEKTKDFSTVSDTLINKKEFNKLCDVNMNPKPPISLFKILADNSVENKPLDNSCTLVPSEEFNKRTEGKFVIDQGNMEGIEGSKIRRMIEN